MTQYLWHLNADGWPLERIDTLTGEHVPIVTGGPDKSILTQDCGRPIGCSIPKASGVEWVCSGQRDTSRNLGLNDDSEWSVTMAMID